jgi:hypothetical protein
MRFPGFPGLFGFIANAAFLFNPVGRYSIFLPFAPSSIMAPEKNRKHLHTSRIRRLSV